MNELTFLFETICLFGLLTTVNKLFGKEGVIAWVGIATVLANVITAKNATVFGFSTAIGTVMFASTFLATDILTENYGKEFAKKAVLIGLFSNVVLILATQIALRYIPSPFDYADGAMRTLFSMNLRISISSMVMYFIANMADIFLFVKLKEKTNGKMMWLRNNVSTILCNCLENFGFIFFAFVGIYDIPTIISIAVGTSVIEMLAALIDTPFLYLSKTKAVGGKSEKTIMEKEDKAVV